MVKLFSRFLTYLRRDERLLLNVVIALIVGYAAISAFVFLLPTETVDIWFTQGVQRYQAPWLDAFMNGVSWFATIPGGLITIGTVSIVFMWQRRWLEACFVALSLLAVPIVAIVKRLFGRARPTEDLVRVIKEFHNQSFPSGHVVFYTVLFGFIAFLMYRSTHYKLWVRRLVGWFCIALILLVPVSRMYLGAHWFTDVSAGFILGLLLLIGLVEWYSHAKRRRSKATA
ncbi:phosphatase PAP2 family protein [Neolewinella aurantiaca]|uniref:Phosphatase PAP2 family protein n=1 Tax=Neolewinella aurantiaca TaxID=2602767 RepID=A0A5C7FZM1_9BACT|nr:phosphatase PAP2 family protein [Neolewinella aurantiaca]TXF91146.1 phosphatase PAP2 family protein [Neolewinella aurantiaca]